MGKYPLCLGGEAGGDSVGDLLQEGGRREEGAGDVGLGPCAGGRWKCWQTCHAEMVEGLPIIIVRVVAGIGIGFRTIL